MRLKQLLGISILLVLFACANVLAEGRIHSVQDLKKTTEESDKKSPADESKDLKPFDKLTKDKVVTEGLFTFYTDTTDGSVLMAVRADQLGPIYLCGESLTESDGHFFDNGRMGATFPFYFRRVGKDIQMLEKNLRLRTDSLSTMREAVKATLSDHLFGSTKIMSLPKDSAGAVLIDAGELFIRDAMRVGTRLGMNGQTGHSFDQKNSYFGQIKAFPENCEINVKLHYKTSKPQSGVTLQDGYSMFHTYHYSLSTLPETDYVPRFGDDRVGYFMTIYEDYSTIETESPYVRFIERFHLKKKNPDELLSEPVEPIVFWVENTVPEQYREMIAEAIEWWNPAFEKIGFKNALVAKQMPDTADWDPADVRYNVIQWMIAPGAAYAVGPSRANPYTGQVYDADIRFSADWVRSMYNFTDRYVKTVNYDGNIEEAADNFLLGQEQRSLDEGRFCTYQREAAREATLGLAYLSTSVDNPALTDELVQKYVHQYLVEILAHEVGHTLGIKHNFKASTVYSLDQINDPEFTRKNGTVGTIMDYAPPNVAGPGKVQGDFFSACPGPYDMWAIEYGYKDFGAAVPEDEVKELKAIASRSGDPLLRLASDEDTFGWSPKAVDPLANLHDLGDDPLRYALHVIDLTKTLWSRMLDRFDEPGIPYSKLRSIFDSGWRAYSTLALVASKYVGGLYTSRAHQGDENGTDPLTVVPAAEQRKAVQLLKDNLFAADAFDLPDELHTKLQAQRMPDFLEYRYTVPTLDYPFHQIVLNQQRQAIYRLYDPYTLGRLLNNLQLVKPGDDVYTMIEMFTDVRRAIWGEIVGPENVNSFRRQLQLAHLDLIIQIFLSNPASYPTDARTLASNDMEILYRAASSAVGSTTLDEMTKAHFKEAMRQINAARSASLTYAR